LRARSVKPRSVAQNPCSTGICESRRSRAINCASFPDLVIFTLVVSRLVSAEKSNPVKLQPYECGIEPITDARDRYSIRYYLIAMLFVIFEVETIFMFPWAVALDRLAVFGLIEMLVFLFILIVGYFYAWRKGALEWQ
jgi:NADH-quinone oxidoreductase subunit A